MKPVKRHKQFEKNFKKRIAPHAALTDLFVDRLTLFMAGHRQYPLADHALTGSLKGKRAFSIANDIRVIYLETPDEYLFLDIGTHAQVYK